MLHYTFLCREKNTVREVYSFAMSEQAYIYIIHQLICTMQAKRACSNYKEESSSYRSRFLVIGTHKDCIKPEDYSDVLDAYSEGLKKTGS